MKHIPSLPCLAAGLVWLATLTPAVCAPSTGPSSAPTPVSELGTKVAAQYQGDGLSVVPTPEGARLRCVFQKLEGQATPAGLWLTSTVEPRTGAKFRVVACALGREGTMSALPPQGAVTVADKLVRYLRPGLTEEYSVSVDGVRQDFVVAQQPAGDGALRVELDVTGARAEALANGARLVLDGSGRKLAYSRLQVFDAEGKELTARVEVTAETRLAVLVEDLAATYPVRIDPTFSDANWISLGGLPGADDIVYAAVVDSSGNLYVGGEFTVIGTVVANCIAKWDGSAWAALGSGMESPYSTVQALAVSGTNLYAGGSFATAGGAPANRIAKWNGSAWSALGSGVDNSVYALAVSGADLYAGGVFATAGGASAKGIAKWDGNGWSALGSGMSWNSYVYALAMSGTNLYVGGSFTSAGGVSATNIAKWDGNTWSALGSGMRGEYDGSVYALAVSGTNLYAGGSFYIAGGVVARGIAKWNGTTWSDLDWGVNDNSNYSINALAVSGTILYAGGNFDWIGNGVYGNGIAKWNGYAWSALGSGGVRGGRSYSHGAVLALAVLGTNLYAGGDFDTAGGVSANNAAKWNGSAWTALGSGMNDSVYALAVSGADLYAGGVFITAGGVTVNHIAKWNGNSWSALGSGMDYIVFALAVSGSDLYAGGYFAYATNGTSTAIRANRIAKWNGTTWSALDSGMNENSGVDALAVSGADLYASGSFTSAGGVSADGIAKWNGSTWSALGSGISGGVFALAVSGTNLYAGGNFTSAGGVPANRIAKWNGSVWSALGSGMNYSVGALAVSGTNLYAGGAFTTAGGVPANRIAKWNGSVWSALGSGIDIYGVLALAVSGTDLYAGGNFDMAGGVNASCIAKWNGSAWSALGSGIHYGVNALAVSGTDLYAGGGFTMAGGKASAFVAQADLGGIITSSPLPTGTAGTAYNQTLTAAGGTVPYTWSITSGGLPSGLDLSSSGEISGTPDEATNASFAVRVVGGSFSATGAFTLTIYPASKPLATAINQPDWIIGNSASQPWFAQTTNTHDGLAAAQSGSITNSQESCMQTTLTGPGMLTYWRKVSSESGFDYLEFYLDGVLQSGRISGEVGWQRQTNSIPAGAHTVKWRYMKDRSDSSGLDAGWVDEVSYAGPPPLQFAVANGSLSVSNGVFTMRLTGPAGAGTVVDRSFDLTTWAPWQTNSLPVGGLDLAVPMETNGQQFFRARMP